MIQIFHSCVFTQRKWDYQLKKNYSYVSVQFNHSVVSDSLRPHESQHARPPCPSPTPRVYPNPRPLSWWCHPAISSSVIPFSSCPQSLPASESFLMSQVFAWGGQSTGVSASTSVLPMNTQDWSPLGWTGWISLPPKGLLCLAHYLWQLRHGNSLSAYRWRNGWRRCGGNITQLLKRMKSFTICNNMDGTGIENLPANAGDLGSLPGSGRSPGGGNGNPLQYPCLQNPTDRGTWGL